MRSFFLLPVLLSALFLTLPITAVDLNNNEDAPMQGGVVYTEVKNLSQPNRIAVIEVEGYGTIRIELYDNMAPITTQNFVDLANRDFYDGIMFHRCIDDFVAQTGDPNTKNMNPYDDGSGGSGTTIPLEINYNATHIDGAVGMARSSEPDSASSQFYICDGPQHGLDDEVRMADSGSHGYAVFGVVVEGLDIAKRIAGTETYGSTRPLLKDHPVDDIIMTSVTIEEGDWSNFTAPEEENDVGDSGSKSDTPALGLAGLGASVIMISVILIERRKRGQSPS